MATKYDAIVIGTGQAGPPLAVRLAETGMNVAIIERKLFGGTCVNVGCIPTKTLVASARAAHLARRATEFGVMIDCDIKVDMKRVKARKDEVVRYSSKSVETWLRSNPNLAVFQGHGRFESPNTISVNGELLEGSKIIINVGGHAYVPDVPGIKEIDYLTSSTMMDVDFLPEHLVVVGGSYIGLEFAQMYRRFGSRVTVVEKMPKLLPREDDDVAEEIRAILGCEGIELRTDAECMELKKEGGRVVVGLACKDGPPLAEGSHLLLAVGRVPNTQDLGLDKSGIDTDERGYIKVDDECRTSAPGVWALGEANGRGAFTHTSYNDYEIVAANLFDGERRRISDRIPADALFIDPVLGRAGMNESEA